MVAERDRVAIVGAGIAGLTAARALDADFDVTVFEAADYVGGHTRSLTVPFEGRDVVVDIGFIVFNDWTYPNFIRMLDELGVASQPTSMGFSLSDTHTGLEYRGGTWSGLFAQRRNALRPSYYRFLLDIKRFFADGKRALEHGDDSLLSQTLGEFIARHGYGKACVEQFILPMAGAIWSTEPSRVREFPAAFFLRFFANHGLLNLSDRPTWRTITGGSATYVARLRQTLSCTFRVNDAVTHIERDADGVRLHAAASGRHEFDYVVAACHSDQALAMLGDVTRAERAALQAIAYQDNEVILHSDTRLLPQRERAWAAWNYHRDHRRSDAATLTYNMNILQHLGTQVPLCVTLNSRDRIDPAKVLHVQTMAHPLYTAGAVAAQAALRKHGAKRRTAFAGAYLGNGFHEDGVVSGLDAAQAIRAAARAAPSAPDALRA